MNFSEFAPDVWGEISDVPQPAVVRAVRSAARVFCRESEAWRVTAKATAIRGLNSVGLEIPSYSVPVTVHGVLYAGRKLTATNVQQMMTEHPEWFEQTGRPERYYLEDSGTFRLFPIPAEDSVYNVLVDTSVMPTVTATQIDDGFVDQHYETLLAGAFGMLYSQVGRPWYKRTMSDQMMAHFYASIEPAASRARMDHVNRGLTTAYGGI